MWGSWHLLVHGIKTVQKLPDTGGHWVEFLTMSLVSAIVGIIGGGTAVASTYALIVTHGFARRIDELSPRNRLVATWVFAGVGFTMLVVAAGIAVFLVRLWAQLA